MALAFGGAGCSFQGASLFSESIALGLPIRFYGVAGALSFIGFFALLAALAWWLWDASRMRAWPPRSPHWLQSKAR